MKTERLCVRYNPVELIAIFNKMQDKIARLETRIRKLEERKKKNKEET